jgi:hypothetical protein
MLEELAIPVAVARVPRADAERAGGERQHHGREQGERPGAERARARRQNRPQDDERAGENERHRHRVGDLADRPREAVAHPLPSLAAVPAQVERERQEHARGDQREAHHVVVVLLQRRRARTPPRRRAAGAWLRSLGCRLLGRRHG